MRRAAIATAVDVVCFCPPTDVRRLVVVRGRQRNPPPSREHVAIVPRLQCVVRTAIERRYAGLRVRCDSGGVPTSIALDPQTTVADDETGYRIRRFRRR